VNDFSYRESDSINQVEGNGNKNRKVQQTLGTFLWRRAEIAPNNPAGIRHLRDAATGLIVISELPQIQS